MNAVSMDNLWRYLQGLSLTASNRRWLMERLAEPAAPTETMKERKKELAFPKIPKDYTPSPEVLAMTLGPLPKDIDLEKELNERWEEWAR
ncbi:MAG: hypothetical protein IJK42_13405 [Prevotella sp.]|nr:hypothetical protein [Prevotella sp.]MBQ6210744.1 hypothetical protein [Prevotella sp.]